ncbi:MAG: hypothetical protein JWM57_1324 [Phycisphaerales bacterium]|nr:hypothetical protein [Phycisphaerales bacterium]
MDYSISKGGFGKRTVSFTCTKCAEGLKVPLASAGEYINCPTCGQQLKVPGTVELAAERELQKRQEAEKAQRLAAEIASRKSQEQRRQAEADAAEAERQQRSSAAAQVRAERQGSGVSLGVAAGVSGILILVALAILWLSVVHPMREELTAQAEQIRALTQTVSANAATANENAARLTRAAAQFGVDIDKLAKRNLDLVSDLAALRADHNSLLSTVNYNANIANSNNRRY